MLVTIGDEECEKNNVKFYVVIKYQFFPLEVVECFSSYYYVKWSVKYNLIGTTSVTCILNHVRSQYLNLFLFYRPKVPLDVENMRVSFFSTSIDNVLMCYYKKIYNLYLTPSSWLLSVWSISMIQKNWISLYSYSYKNTF